MKLGKNQPCPCGSEKKYKKCCMGKLSLGMESYYELLHREGVIKDKLMRWMPVNFSEDELDDLAQLFSQQDFKELMEDEEERVSFFDWLFMEAVHPLEKRRILEIISEEAGLFEDDELKIIRQWLDNTQTGIYEIQEVNKDKHTFTLREIFTGKEYEILDVKGSEYAVRGDVFFARVQEIFSKYYLSGALMGISRMNLSQFKEFIKQRLGEEKKKEPALSYEEFMNTKGRVVNEFHPEPPKFLAGDGEEASICEAIYTIEQGKTEEIVDYFAGDKRKFKITGEEYSREGAIKSARIALVTEKKELKSAEEGETITFTNWVDEKGVETATKGSISIKGRKLTLFSISKKAFAEAKKELEEKFKDCLELEKEEIKSTKEALEEKKDAWEEDDLEEGGKKETSREEQEELKEIGKQYLENYYKEWCDMDIPALGGKTPREAIETEEGKQQLKELLLDIENAELHKKKRRESYVEAEKIIRKELNFYD